MTDLDDSLFAKIQCPTCGESIALGEALRRELAAETQARVRSLLADQQTALFDREQALKRRESLIEDAEAIVESRVRERIIAESTAIESSARLAARAEVEMEIRELRGALEERDQAVREAREMELQLRKERRAIEQQKEALSLEISRKLDTERAALVEDAIRRTQEEHRLRDAEKDRKLQDALKVNDELRRKLEQGSQQTQGEVLEATLEDSLRASYPWDVIDPVPKGIRGADVVQRVHTRSGLYAGAILWESKNTKNWNESWIDKVKDDQRSAKADIVVLVTTILPKGIDGCGFRDGVWIAEPRLAIGLGTALRSGLVELLVAKRAVAGKNEAIEVLFNYLTGPEFRQHVEALVRTFVDMQAELAEEKRSAIRRWAKREKQIARVIDNTSSMYGDLQGLLGGTIPSIAALEAGIEDRGDGGPPVFEAASDSPVMCAAMAHVAGNAGTPPDCPSNFTEATDGSLRKVHRS